MNLNQIALPTVSVPASAAFYRSLGFTAIVDTPQYARFKATEGNTTFSLIQADVANPGGVTIYFEVRNLEEQVARLRAVGIDFTEEVKLQPWLWKEARLKDPSGNNLCLFWAGEQRLAPNA